MDEQTSQVAIGKVLGRCPGCAADIPASRLLIRYETGDGLDRRYAECPDCLDVVHPA